MDYALTIGGKCSYLNTGKEVVLMDALIKGLLDKVIALVNLYEEEKSSGLNIQARETQSRTINAVDALKSALKVLQ